MQAPQQPHVDLLSPEGNRPARGRAWPALAVYTLTIVGIFAVQGVLGVLFLLARGTPLTDAAQVNDALTSPDITAAFMLTTQALMAATAVAGAWLAGGSVRQNLGLVRPRISLAQSVVVAVASLAFLHMGQLLMWCWLTYLSPGEAVGLEAVLRRLTPAGVGGYWLMLMLAPALGEELLFRGYMQRRLLWCWSPAAAIGVATVCFSLLHIPVWWFLAVVPLGAWFGIVAWRTNSIWPSVACHAAVNGYWTLWPLCHVAGWVPEDRPWGFLPVELVVSGICLGFSLRWFVRLDATALSITPEPVLVTPRVVAEGALLD